MLLVYERMSNRSLRMHVYNTNVIFKHDIVLGLGSMLLYIHQKWEQCGLHRDIKIKATNIMFYASFNTKLF
jgi:hypothetical protein